MKVLIAEDDAISRRMLEAFLVKWGYEVVVTTQGEEAWRVLQANDAPQIAILDWMMPGKDGVELCRCVRQRTGRAYTYLILLTARGHKQDIVEGIEAGADDYVTKPFDPFELRARLRAGRRIIELQEQLLAAHEALRDQASRDPLTDLWNHGAILDILRKEVARATRGRSSLAVAMIDLDQFKVVNDTYGHMAGDAVLRETARRLRGAMRTYDSLGRYGGDEFLAVLPGCDPAAAARFGESFRARLDRNAVDTSEGLIPVALTLGLVAVGDLRFLQPEALVRLADAALYRAKIAGRNCVAVATPEDVQAEISKLTPESNAPAPSASVASAPESSTDSGKNS